VAETSRFDLDEVRRLIGQVLGGFFSANRPEPENLVPSSAERSNGSHGWKKRNLPPRALYSSTWKTKRAASGGRMTEINRSRGSVRGDENCELVEENGNVSLVNPGTPRNPGQYKSRRFHTQSANAHGWAGATAAFLGKRSAMKSASCKLRPPPCFVSHNAALRLLVFFLRANCGKAQKAGIFLFPRASGSPCPKTVKLSRRLLPRNMRPPPPTNPGKNAGDGKPQTGFPL